MIFYLLLAIYAVLFAILSWRRPIWSLALIIFALPSYLIRFQFAFVPLTLLELMILIAFAVCLLKSWLGREHCGLRGKPFSFLALLWILAASLAIIFSDNHARALGLWKAYFIEPVLFFTVLVNTVKNKKDFYLLVYALGLSTFFVSALGIYQHFTGWLVPDDYWLRGEGHRVTSFFNSPNALGLYVGPTVVLFFGLLFSLFQKEWQKIKTTNLFYIIVILSGILAIIFAKSEGAMLGIAAGMFLVLLLVNKYTRLAALVSVGLVVITFFLVPNFKNFLYEKATLADWSGQVRRDIWAETWELIKDRPIQGAGLASYQTAIKPYHKKDFIEIFPHPHNIILTVWVELGISGVILFIAIITRYVIVGWQAKRNKNHRILVVALWGVMTVILVHGLVDAPYFKNDLSVMFWLFLGLMARHGIEVRS